MKVAVALICVWVFIQCTTTVEAKSFREYIIHQVKRMWHSYRCSGKGKQDNCDTVLDAGEMLMGNSYDYDYGDDYEDKDADKKENDKGNKDTEGKGKDNSGKRRKDQGE